MVVQRSMRASIAGKRMSYVALQAMDARYVRGATMTCTRHVLYCSASGSIFILTGGGGSNNPRVSPTGIFIRKSSHVPQPVSLSSHVYLRRGYAADLKRQFVCTYQHH